jgi:protein-S-isoprenylcysteine O-methyltransferase Ste14
MSRELLVRWRVGAGYPLALVCLWLADPAPAWLAAGAAVGAAGLLVRGAAAGHLRKHRQLATAGPYARTRNPLYFGSFLLAAGVVVAARSWWVAAIVVGYFALFYPAVMRREEEELRAQYGDAYREYARRVPLFWPRLGAAADDGEGGEFSWELWRRNREYQAAIGFALTLALLAARMWLRG